MIEFPETQEYLRPPSVLDEVEFMALPEPVRALVCRLFVRATGLGDPHDQLLRDAYEAGWEDAINDATVESHGPSDRDITIALKSIIKDIVLK